MMNEILRRIASLEKQVSELSERLLSVEEHADYIDTLEREQNERNS
jgi:hypothetical protein